MRSRIRETQAELARTLLAIRNVLTFRAATTDARQATIRRAKAMLENVEYKGQGICHAVAETTREHRLPLALLGLGLSWLIIDRVRATGNGAAERRLEEEIGETETAAACGAGEVCGSELGAETGGGRWQSAKSKLQERMSATQRRAGDVTSKVRQRAAALGGGFQDRGQQAAKGLWQTVHDHPLAVGATAVILGAVVGLVLPESRQEREVMGGARNRLLQKAKEKGQETGEKIVAVAAEAREAAAEKAREEGLV